MSSLGEHVERRDKSLAGTWDRAQFNLSLKSVIAFGFREHVVGFCRERARTTGRLPHEVIIEIVEAAIRRAAEAAR